MDMLFTGIGVLSASKVVVLRKHLQVEPLKGEGRERTKLPLVSFDYGFSTQESADTHPILIRRDDGQRQTRVTCCERKDPIPYLIPFLVDWRILSKGENEPSMKVFQESMSHLIVRETKRQYRSLRTSEECTNVKITHEISRLNWILHFAVKFLNKRRIDRRRRKPRVQF